MKRCRFCAEEIQDAAIVCRFCGRDLAGKGVALRPSSSLLWWPAYATWALVSLLAGVVVVALVMTFLGAYAKVTTEATYERENPWQTPTVAGLRQVVLGKGLPCIDAPNSNKARKVEQNASSAVWELDCPTGDRYVVTLARDSTVLSVRRR